MTGFPVYLYLCIVYFAFPYVFGLSINDALQFDQSRKRYISSLLDLRESVSKRNRRSWSARKRRNLC